MNIPVITIDGPSGCGKGTVSERLAKHLGWHFLDSGVLYRALVIAARKNGINSSDISKLADIAKNLDITFSNSDVWLDGENVTDTLREVEVTQLSSIMAAIAPVRQALIERQKQFRQPPGLVTDGRDMGTVIFPDANLKIFLTASLEERAKRRFNQLKQKGINVSLEQVLDEQTERDVRDKNRATAPLKPASDAITIDTTQLSIDEVFMRVLAEVENVFA